MSSTLIKMKVEVEMVNGNSNINSTSVTKTIYKTMDEDGNFIFRQKGKVARELLEKLLDHGFYDGVGHIVWIAMNYDSKRYGSEIDTKVDYDADSMTLKLKKK